MEVSGQRHAPAALLPGKRPDTNCVGGLVDPSRRLDWCGKSRRHRTSIPGPSRSYRVGVAAALFGSTTASLKELG